MIAAALSTDAETFLIFLALFALGCLLACLLTAATGGRE
jgi:hypothetical protein